MFNPFKKIEKAPSPPQSAKAKAQAEHYKAIRKQGAEAEDAFEEWLKSCKLPYTYFHQNKISFNWHLPPELNIKRPDFLVGLTDLGSVAIDNKAHKVQEREGNGFFIKQDEAFRFRNFSSYFLMPVFYIFMPPQLKINGKQGCCIISNERVSHAPLVKYKSESHHFIEPTGKECFIMEHSHLRDVLMTQKG